jgi:hypothetical protein
MTDAPNVGNRLFACILTIVTIVRRRVSACIVFVQQVRVSECMVKSTRATSQERIDAVSVQGLPVPKVPISRAL